MKQTVYINIIVLKELFFERRNYMCVFEYVKSLRILRLYVCVFEC